MSLFEGLSIGTRGLAASQMGIHVTGENIANANTEGYSRKRIALTSDNRKDATYGQMGFGVDVRFVERIRNIFIDRQLTQQVSNHGFMEMVDYGYERIENIHQEPSENGISQVMDEFWNAWSDVANNPADKSSREALRSTTIVMTERLHYTANEMRSYKLAINDEIEVKALEINNLAKQIADLNGKIAAAEGLQTQNANDSRDQRDQLIKELATIVSISYFEDGTGAVTVTASGSMLVSPQKAYEIEPVRQSIIEADGFRFSYNTLRFIGSASPFEPQGGELKALFVIRDKIIPGFMNELDALVGGIVREVNAKHETGYNLMHMTGLQFFDSTKLTASTISLSAAVLNDSNNISAAQGGNIVTPMTTNISSNANNLIDLSTVDPRFRNLVLDSIRVVDPLSGSVLEEGPNKDYVVDYELGRIQILNPAYAPGTAFDVDFKYNDRGFSGVGDGNNAISISLLRDAKTMNPNSDGQYTHGFNSYYAGYIGRLGVERNQAASELETQKYLVEQLTNQQQSISGVNLDEEMANLIKYQQTFQASARFMTTVGDMLDVLMRI